MKGKQSRGDENGDEVGVVVQTGVKSLENVYIQLNKKTLVYSFSLGLKKAQQRH